MDKIADIPLEKIKSVGNIRIVQVDDAVLELAESLSANGLEVPIHVYPDKGEYVIKFGHRRVAAAKHLGWETVRAIVLEDEAMDATELIIAQYIENEQRQGLSYIDKARTYAVLKAQGVSQKDIARRFGVSDAAVSLETIARPLSVFFRAGGGPAGVAVASVASTINAAPPAASGRRASQGTQAPVASSARGRPCPQIQFIDAGWSETGRPALLTAAFSATCSA